MNVELIGVKEYKELTAELRELRQAVTASKTESDRLNILSTFDFQQRFGISKVTQWKLRKSGKLPYFTIGRQVFYRVEQLDQLLQS